MLTDGTSLEGYVLRVPGYYGPAGRVLTARPVWAEHFWIYALAYRISGDPVMWDLARNIARGSGWGDIGAGPAGEPAFRTPNTLVEPYVLLALLELAEATGRPAFL